MPPPSRTVVCFGEVLWDILPAGMFPGGAPFNVAYHLGQLGLVPHLVSSVGRDLLGDELRRRLAGWGMDTSGVARHSARPTGYVRAELSSGGEASYRIAPGVAWDRIALRPETMRTAGRAAALVFGSLALRSVANRKALARLLAVLPSQAWRVFDVNLRAPHDDLALVRKMAAAASLLKLNSAEAVRLAGTTGRSERLVRRIAAQTGCQTVCLTAGARGAGLLYAGHWYWEAGRRIRVADTVGAGDSFLAALLAQLIAGAAPAHALAQACRLGEFVAGCSGATPIYPARSGFTPGAFRR